MALGRRHALPVYAWPAADQALWQSIIAESNILDDSGPAAHWAPTTRDNVRKAYGYWLHWLGGRGLLDPMEPPMDRISPERIKGYIEAVDRRGILTPLVG